MADPAKPNAGDGLDKTQIEPRIEATRIEGAPVFRNLNLDGMSPGQTVATQDLSGDKMILAAPRINYNGVQVPALGGIPLLAKLGQGGMGAVYYGIHPRLNKEIAVKVLPFHLAEQQPDMVKRFFREAQIAAMVQSPHLVSAMDVNEEKGLVYLVMEYVNGESAGAYLRKIKQAGQVVSESVALDICIAGTEGLAGAHNGGIIHRDIKPDNVLIPKNRATNQLNFKAAKLADLGLARGEELGQSLTMGQACMGTPGYMSPEQAMDAKSVGKPADVFSMGAMLYALLCGNAPFTGSTAMKIVMDTAQQPHKPLRELREDASPQISALIDKCLAKAPEKRYADADALLEALREVRGGRGSTNVAVAPVTVQVTKEDRKVQIQALLAEATRMAATNPNTALDKLAEAERKMQGDGDEGTILVDLVAEMAEQRRLILQACNRKTHEVDIWHALSNAIPMAMEARKAGDWDVMVAALEGPLNALGTLDHPNKALAEKLLAQARESLGKSSSPSVPGGITLELGNGIKLALMQIPAGEFMMGSPATESGRSANEIPHKVTISRAFAMSSYQITQAQYEQVIGSNPSEFKGRDNPVEMVSWDDAQEFCKRVSAKTGKMLRLPTEAEWEYACRAGTTTPFHFGETISVDQANYDGNFTYGSGQKGVYRQKTTPVGSFKPNNWGLYDMHANIWEWCQDWYAAYKPEPVTDPRGPETGKHRVMRGGSWNYRPALCRSATRYWDAPGERSSRRGFRVVCI